MWYRFLSKKLARTERREIVTTKNYGKPLYTQASQDVVGGSRGTGERSLKRTLGVFQLTALGVGAIIGAGIFVLSGLGAHYAGPGLMLSFVLSGLGCAFAGLCYAEFAAMIPLAGSAYTYAYATLGELFAWIIGWDLTLEYAMGASTVSSGWSNHFIELLDILHIKMPLWLAYDHWTGLAHGGEDHRPRNGPARDHSLVPGTQAFLAKVSDIVAAQSPDLLRRAHDLLGAPRLFGYEIGFNLPAFLIALVITAILVIGIRESARFNATIVVVKVSVVLFVIGLGIHVRQPGNWGIGWSTFAPYRLFGNRRRRGLHLFRLHRIRRGLHHRAGGQESAARPAHRDHRLAAGLHRPVYSVAAVLTGMVPWRERQHRGAHRAGLPGPRAHRRSHVITLGALAGLTSVMLVMLLGQTRVLYAMANDGLLPRKFFADIHPKFRTPWKNTILVGLLAAVVGSVTPIDDIGKMVNIGTLLAFVIVCIAVMVLRRTNPGQPRPFRTPWVPVVPAAGHLLQRVHDVQAGLDQLGAADHLAGDRPGGLFHLQPASQQGTGRRRQALRLPGYYLLA